MRKLKIGDRVREDHFGIGTIIDIEGSSMPYLVEFDKENEECHDGRGQGKENHCFWCYEEDLSLAKFTKDDLREGDKLTLRNGEIGYYCDGMCIDGLFPDDIRSNLTNSGDGGSALDIIKVERPSSYVAMYERADVRAREMTVKEISKELGYEVKIVKGD